MGKEVPFDPDSVCDSCGAEGAYDLYGRHQCVDCCFADFEVEDEEKKDDRP